MDNYPSNADIENFCARNEVTIYNKLEVNDENSFRRVFSGRANNFVAIMENKRVDSIHDLHLDRRSDFCAVKCLIASNLYGFLGTRGGVEYFDNFPISTWYVTIRGHGYFVVGRQTVAYMKEHSLLIERLLEKQISCDPSTPRIIQKPHDVWIHHEHVQTPEEYRRDFQIISRRCAMPSHEQDVGIWQTKTSD
jgi:hypothetical protein